MTPLKPSYAGYVYLIGSRKFGWYKIGKSKRAEIRIADIGILLPFKIEVFAVWGTPNETLLESELHSMYQNYRINGEWFGFERDYVFGIVGVTTTFPSVLIHRLGSGTFSSSNIEKDFECQESRDWKRLKAEAFSSAVADYMNENELEKTKENRKTAKNFISKNRERYLLKLSALQSVRSVFT